MPPSDLPVSETALRCRPILRDDVEPVISLLQEGFPYRSRDYWRRGLARHLGRVLPAGYPEIGYLLEADGVAVGVLLTLYTSTEFRDGEGVRCNLSSWYVDPRFRSYATLLDRLPLRRKEVTFLNISPAPHTFALQEARRFTRYCRGQMLVFPLLSRPRADVHIRLVDAEDPLVDVGPSERTLIRDHLAYGCICLIWSDGGPARPLVLQRQKIGSGGLVPKLKLPVLHVIYCRTLDDIARVASALGRLLLRHFGMPWILLDVDQRIAGLAGPFLEGRGVKFTRGPHPVRLGDLAYTETVLFGP